MRGGLCICLPCRMLRDLMFVPCSFADGLLEFLVQILDDSLSYVRYADPRGTNGYYQCHAYN